MFCVKRDNFLKLFSLLLSTLLILALVPKTLYAEPAVKTFGKVVFINQDAQQHNLTGPGLFSTDSLCSNLPNAIITPSESEAVAINYMPCKGPLLTAFWVAPVCDTQSGCKPSDGTFTCTLNKSTSYVFDPNSSKTLAVTIKNASVNDQCTMDLQ